LNLIYNKYVIFFGGDRMRIDQLETPALLIDADIFEQNMETMRQMLEGTGISLRPHYKSHKCAEIARMQIAHGAKGITCAKLGEAEDLAAAGIEDILIANEIVQPTKVMRVAALAKRCRLTICVDHLANIEALSRAAVAADATIHCLVELDVGAGRCGARNDEEFVELAQAVSRAQGLVFEGIQAYAGYLSHEVDEQKRHEGAQRIETRLCGLKSRLEELGLPVKEISGGSSGTAAIKRNSKVYTELQAGSYLFMDSTYQELKLSFRNSLVLLATVISAHDDALITDAGVKSCGVDQNMPTIVEDGLVLDSINEEHGLVKGKIAGYQVGDTLRYIPGHSCTTFNLHECVYLVRGDQVIERIPVTSRGKIQ
jgi:D-serine deaminase-like pyridoxal phosphate-dependent protein